MIDFYKEVGSILMMNGAVLLTTIFTDIEVILKIVLLLVTIVYTIEKWLKIRKENEVK